MASSQVETVSLGSSFGCILRDRNQRHNGNDVFFRKNLKAQVKIFPAAISDENAQNRVDSSIGNKPKKSNSCFGSSEKPLTRKVKNVSDSEKQSTRETSKSNVNVGGASSLVQIWEARLNRSNGGNSPILDQLSEKVSEASVEEIDFSTPFFFFLSTMGHNWPTPFMDGESESENEMKNPNQKVEIKSAILHTVSDSGENKCGGIAEIIRKLSNELKLTVSGDNDSGVETPMSENNSFPMVTCSPRLQKRQPLSDLLVQQQRDRHCELESVLKRNAVSKFPQRGPLQSMLRLRSLKRSLVIQDRYRGSTTGDLNRFEPGSTVLQLRENIQQNDVNAATETKRTNGQESTVETERIRSKDIHLKTSFTEQFSPRVWKNKTESKMSDFQLKETTVAELEIPENEEAKKVESSLQGTRETLFLQEQETPFLNGMEEQEVYEDEQSYYRGMSYDWFTEISRPRTYWEELRESRYQEVMNTRADKDDVRRLLQRRTVSSFLGSGLREKIEKLMKFRAQTHSAQKIEDASPVDEKSEISKNEDADRDESSQPISPIYAQSPAGSWSSQDIGVTSTPVHRTNSTEMDIISDMRSQILQLQLEISELRNSVKTCLNANASLQKSIYRENPLKRTCFLCNETQVEALLYRCGHMCTCLRCANELQCNEGKCPICRAKILGVVRVFVDSKTLD